MTIYLQRKVANLKKGDRVIGDMHKPGPTTMAVKDIKIAGKTATVLLDTFTGLGYREMKFHSEDMVNISIDKHKFIEK